MGIEGDVQRIEYLCIMSRVAVRNVAQRSSKGLSLALPNRRSECSGCTNYPHCLITQVLNEEGSGYKL